MESKDLLTLRKTIGLISIFMIPFCLLFTKLGIPWVNGEVDSYSMFYWTNARNIFVGGITFLSIVYCLYPGYEWIDRVVNIATALLMYAVIVFPCWNNITVENGYIRNFDLFPTMNAAFADRMHGWVGTFNLLAQVFNVGFLFTKHGEVMTPQKKIRNVIYYVCSGIVLFFFLMIITMTISGTFTISWWPKFILDIQIICFALIGFCWLVKGEFFKFLNDR